MKNINWKVRFKNPVFIAQVVVAVFAPILAYMGLTIKDITSWNILIDLLIKAIQNPYVIGLIIVSAFHSITDPTTKGIKDSNLALSYKEPKE